MLKIDTLVVGPLETNCYILRDGGDCWVVDAGIFPRPLVKFLRSSNSSPSRILLTHGHADHIAGVAKLKKAFPTASVTCPAGDAAMLCDPKANLSGPFGILMSSPEADELIEPGQILALGASRWEALDTSGHTPGGVSFYCGEHKVVITGDALFAGSIGRTDIPGASSARLLRNIREKLLSLPEDTRVLPGHGGETTIGSEKLTNPFFL